MVKNKIVSYLTIILGLFLVFVSIKSFITSLELYKTFRFERDFSGSIYAARYYLPFFQFIISILVFLYGLILIKRSNIIFKFLILFSLTITIYHLLQSLVVAIYCLVKNCNSDYKILEFGGILFFTLLISDYYKYDWKKEVRNISYKKIIVSVIVIFLINRILSLS